MIKGHLPLADWLDSAFFEKGAFLADFETGDILLGKKGRTYYDTSLGYEEGFYLKDFFEDSYRIYIPSEWTRASRSELLKVLAHYEDKITVTSSSNQDELWADDFSELSRAWDEGIRKVVLVSREEYEVKDPTSARIALIKKAISFGVGMPYGIWSGDYGMVGSTPELLYAVKGQNLETFALAGTGRIGQENELLNSTKDRLEHDLVIKDIEEKLSPYCERTEVHPTGLTSYKDIIHLKTDIKGILKSELNFTALTSTLSPTAALGGYPKEAGLNFLRETEYSKRHTGRFFGSAFGLVGELNQSVVAIRNVQWQGDTFFIESGGGVLPESVLEKELNEIRLKRETIKRHYL